MTPHGTSDSVMDERMTVDRQPEDRALREQIPARG